MALKAKTRAKSEQNYTGQTAAVVVEGMKS